MRPASGMKERLWARERGGGGGRPSRAVTEGESFDLAQWVCWVLCPIPRCGAVSVPMAVGALAQGALGPAPSAGERPALLTLSQSEGGHQMLLGFPAGSTPAQGWPRRCSWHQASLWPPSGDHGRLSRSGLLRTDPHLGPRLAFSKVLLWPWFGLPLSGARGSCAGSWPPPLWVGFWVDWAKASGCLIWSRGFIGSVGIKSGEASWDNLPI